MAPGSSRLQVRRCSQNLGPGLQDHAVSSPPSPLPLSILYVRLTSGQKAAQPRCELQVCRIGDALNRQNPALNSHQPGRDDEDPRWVWVATAPDQLLAEMWQQLLLEASIPSMLAPQDTVSFLGITPMPVRLMVPLEMVPRAEEALAGLAADCDTGSDPE